MDEVLALPSQKAARIALRTQQVIAHETGVPNVADPLGGSHYVEWMTDELEGEAEQAFARLDQLGDGSMLEGVYAGIETGWFQGEIAEAAYQLERKISSGRRVVVGVNRFTEADDDPLAILTIGPEVEERQLKRLDTVRGSRRTAQVQDALARVARDAADPAVNLMPAMLEAVRAYATLGEIVAALEGVFGRWREDPVI
jgi:methylmalonyl-CoA mutase N-terminal domain/subunit